MSSEKRFEYIENKIKEAAENNHIVFEEKSWNKMEVLLDKEDKGKPIFWLWFLLPIALLCSYGLFTMLKNENKKIAQNTNENKIEKIDTSKKRVEQTPIIDEQINTSNNNKIPVNIVDRKSVV